MYFFTINKQHNEFKHFVHVVDNYGMSLASHESEIFLDMVDIIIAHHSDKTFGGTTLYWGFCSEYIQNFLLM